METLSNRQLSFGYWYVTHKLLLQRLVTIILLVIDFALIGYLLFLLALNLGIRQQAHDALIGSLLTNGGFASVGAARDAQLPQNIRVVGIETIPSGTRADIIATVTNPNARWGASFSYSFSLANGATSPRTGFIFPGETKRLYDLNVEGGVTAGALNISNITWIRENNFAELYAARIQFSFSDITFTPAQELEIGATIPISRASFTVTNTSAFNYREPNFTVLLYSGDTLAGISLVTAERLLSGERVSFSTTWFTRLPRITSVQVIPEINILDQGVYLPF